MSVKYPVSCWMITASTMPISTATNAIRAGLPLDGATSSNLENLVGRKVKATIATSTSEVTAEITNPRLIGTSPLRSLARSLVARMPTTEDTMPMAPMISGSSRPLAPKATWPRISAATRVTA